ncbi:hypothetical protein ID866_10208 [Astraeus odoratus]|nr:hypothetical protein ID866_10208 [Astraeus odoratus]
MYLTMYHFGFIFLALHIVNASSADLYVANIPMSRVQDANRAKTLVNNRLEKRDGTLYVQKQDVYYMANVVTSSGSAFNLIVDTGSSYTWVGARDINPYLQGDGSMETSQTIRVTYADAHVKLTARTWRDRLTLDGLTVTPQGIGIPTELQGFPDGIDGILGLGPTRFTAGITPDHSEIPTVVDNLYSQGTITHPVLGVYLVPENVRNVGGGGLLSFGSVDATVLTSDVKYIPATQTPPASLYWGVDASLMYDDMSISGPISGVLDTGTLRISLPDDAFEAYQLATGADVAPNTWLTITQDQYNNLRALSILIGDQSYDLSPNAQIYPRSSTDEQILLVVKSIDRDAGIDFKLGSTFFQRYYVVFNSSSSEIGFASHQYTYSMTN